MISYEDLVYALTEWRARKGLPTTTNTVVATPIAVAPAAPASRGGPPAAPPGRAPAPAAAAAPAWTQEPPVQKPQLIYQDDAISVDGEYDEAEASEAMAFDSVRPSTQPGFAPTTGGPPGGQRR